MTKEQTGQCGKKPDNRPGRKQGPDATGSYIIMVRMNTNEKSPMHHKREYNRNTCIITEQHYSLQKEELLENRNAFYVFFSV